MKTNLKKILTACLLFTSLFVHAQVKDIGQSFKNRGFIQNISYDENVMYVNFIAANEISTEVVTIKGTKFVSSNNDSLSFRDLKFNDEIMVEGERFNVDRYSEATKVTLQLQR